MPSCTASRASCPLDTGPEQVLEAEVLFRLALEVAGAQEARALELRAALSLARLLRARAKPAEGRAILECVSCEMGSLFRIILRTYRRRSSTQGPYLRIHQARRTASSLTGVPPGGIVLLDDVCSATEDGRETAGFGTVSRRR